MCLDVSRAVHYHDSPRCILYALPQQILDTSAPSRAGKLTVAQAKRLALVPVHDITRAILILRGHNLKTQRQFKEVYEAIRALTDTPAPKRRGIGFTADIEEKA